MPLPNQDMIHEVVAAHPFVTIIDISDMYEQLHIIPEDVPKPLFSSPLGTYVSNTLQQGDCNGPSSWQRFMTYVFRDRISIEVWVYLDDIYIFLKTIEEHENALEYVFNCLKHEQLFISQPSLSLTQFGLTAWDTHTMKTGSELRLTNWSLFATGLHHHPAKVFRSRGVHFMIPTQHIGIHYATRNVCQQPTFPMERHS